MSELMKSDAFDRIQSKYIEQADKETFAREVSFALQVLNRKSYLNQSTTESKLQAVYNTALTGLTLNPVMKLAYLVPRYSGLTNKIECHLEPSYMGLVKLITDTGSAVTVYAHPVYQGDEFEVSLGTSPDLKHIPKYKSQIIEKFYAVGVLHNGTNQIEVMTAEQVEQIRDKSESYKSFKAGRSKSCIWDSDFSEMGRKTVIRRIVKQLPKTDRFEKLGHAIKLDESDFGITMAQIGMIEGLLIGAKITDAERSGIYSEIDTMSQDRASECIRYLQNLQPGFQDGEMSNASMNEQLDDHILNERS